MKALILIGGLGTRLRPFTCFRPKPMLSIANKPFLMYQLELIKKHGIREVIFCVSYMNGYFKRYFGNGRRFGLKIYYTDEKVPLGTGGAVKNAERFIDETTVIFNGDILSDINLSAMARFHRARGSQLTIALVRVKDPTAFGLVETNRAGCIEKFIEKPSWDEITCNTVNAGIYMFEPGLLARIPAGHPYSLERGLFPHCQESGVPMHGYVYSGYWLDIGTVGQYLQAHFDILEGKNRFALSGRRRGTIWVGPRVHIDRQAVLNGRAVIGAGTRIQALAQIQGMVSVGADCLIKKGALLEDCVVLNHTVIGEGARLRRCIVGNGCRIEPHAQINAQVTLGDRTVIRRYSRV